MHTAFESLLLTAALCVAASSAPAQARAVDDEASEGLEGTLFARAGRQVDKDRLQACDLEFAALVRPSAMAAGLVKVSGVLDFRIAREGVPVYVMKLGLVDNPGPDERAAAPAHAFIRAPGGKVPRTALRLRSDAGYALFMAQVDEATVAAYASMLEQSRFELGFSRRAGRKPSTVIVDLSVVDTRVVGGQVLRTRSRAVADDFGACTVELFGGAAPPSGNSAR